MRYAVALEQLAQLLRFLDRHRPHQHRTPCLMERFDVARHSAELGVLVLVDLVGVVDADHRHVGGDHYHLEIVDLVELLSLGDGGAGHSGKLLIEAEVVLEGYGRYRHVLPLDLDPLFRLD